MHRQQEFNRLQFNHYMTLNQQIQTQTFFKNQSVILKTNNFLPFNFKPPLHQFMS